MNEDDQNNGSEQNKGLLAAEQKKSNSNAQVAQYLEKYKKFVGSLNCLGMDRKIKIEILPEDEKEAVEIVLGSKSLELIVRWRSNIPFSDESFKRRFASRLAGILYDRVNQPEFLGETHITKAFKRVFSSYNLWLPRTFAKLKNVEWYEESRLRGRNYAFDKLNQSPQIKWSQTVMSFLLAQYILSSAMSEIIGKPCFFTLNGFPFHVEEYPFRLFLELDNDSSSQNVLFARP